MSLVIVACRIREALGRTPDELSAVSAGATISLGRTYNSPTATNQGARGGFDIGESAVYAEYQQLTGAATFGVGVATVAAGLTGGPGNGSTWVYLNSGSKRTGGVSTAYGSAIGVGDFVGIAVRGRYVWFFLNGVLQGSAPVDLFSFAGKQAAAFDVGQANVDVGVRFFVGSSTACQGSFNLGEAPFTYDPPSGFVGLFELALTSPERYISTSELVTGYLDTPADTSFEPVIKGRVVYARGVSCAAWERAAERDVSLGVIDMINTGGALDSWLPEVWRDREIEIYRGTRGQQFADFEFVATAIIDGIKTPDPQTIQLTLRDKSALLDVPLQSSTYPELTYAPGLLNMQRPLLLGSCEGVPLTQVNAQTLDYDIHDSDDFYAIDEVLDNGVLLVEGTHWERSTESTVFGLTRLTNPVLNGKQVCTARGPALVSDTLIEQLPDVLEFAIARSSVDVADIDPYTPVALQDASGYPLCYFGRDATTIAEFLTFIMDSFLGWWFFDRLGILRVGRLETPTGEPVATFDRINIRSDIRYTLDEAPGLSDRIGCVPNWSPYVDSEIAASLYTGDPLDLARAEQLKQPFRVKRGTTALHPTYAHAVDADPMPTAISSEDDGQGEADRRCAMFQDEWGFYELTVAIEDSLAYTIEPGDVVLVRVARYGLDDGKKMQVIAVSTDLQSADVAFVLHGPAPRVEDFA